ncbi:MAG: DEAD/DEAH box helicase [Phycisphaerae bacterium]|nr:DEAD/DEAH box helicase [Phycisphaerae bacterium]
MRPEQKSRLLLGVTRSKAKMLEYGVPEEHHIKITQDPAKLFTLSIGLLGDLAAGINRGEVMHGALADMRKNLLFSAQFFDAYVQSQLNEALDPYLLLLGSASYYLCDLPGSAMVLAKHIGGDCPDLRGDGLEDLLLWLLQGDLSTYFDSFEGPFGGHINVISHQVVRFFKNGTGGDSLIDLGKTLRATVYECGTPRQLLFGDVIAAILRKKLHNSSWHALPLYSALPKSKWLPALQKESFIKELWPAQHLLGQADVLKGQSAIVQMPTSAGKTKATELVIRSAFLAERTSLAIIVAPFRSLCHEIKHSLIAAFHDESIKVDELSDVVQKDFVTDELLGHQQIAFPLTTGSAGEHSQGSAVSCVFLGR